jgi:uncharacterized protein (DUF111 family)
MKQTLWIDSEAGISGDWFAAELIGLGAPQPGVIQAIKSAGEESSILHVHIHIEFPPDGTLAHRLHIAPWKYKSRCHWRRLSHTWNAPCPGRVCWSLKPCLSQA